MLNEKRDVHCTRVTWDKLRHFFGKLAHFFPNAPVLYPLKTSGNRKVF